MPKLKGMEESFYKGKKIDKESDTIAYFDDTHEYVDKETGNKGVSVTSLIHCYSNPFDGDFWASYKALEEMMDLDTWLILKKTLLAKKKFDKRFLTKFNIDEAAFEKRKLEILKSYEDNKKEAAANGTAGHAALEQALYKGDKSISKYEFGGNLKTYEGVYNTDLPSGVYPEFLISYKDPDILLCGQIDLLIIDNKEITIIDHKFTKKLDFKSYYNSNTKSNIMMKYPMNNIMDCNGQLYTLQLSMYAWMVQQLHPDYNVKRLSLHWIDRDNNESFIDVPYLKKDVEKMITHYKKHSKINEELDKINFTL